MFKVNNKDTRTTPIAIEEFRTEELHHYQFAYSDFIKESRKVSTEKLPLKNYCQ